MGSNYFLGVRPCNREKILFRSGPMSAVRPSILIIRRRYLGDVVLLGSVFRNLRLHWPTAHLSALVEPAYAPVLALNPDVDLALTLPNAALVEIPGNHMSAVVKPDFGIAIAAWLEHHR